MLRKFNLVFRGFVGVVLYPLPHLAFGIILNFLAIKRFLNIVTVPFRVIAFLFLSTICFTACQTEPFPVESGNGPQANPKLIVTAYHLYNPITGQDSLLPNTTVYLYKTEDDREYNFDIQKEGTTDSTGTTTLYALEEPYYYVRATHADYGQVLEEVGIPDHAVASYLEVVFY